MSSAYEASSRRKPRRGNMSLRHWVPSFTVTAHGPVGRRATRAPPRPTAASATSPATTGLGATATDGGRRRLPRGYQLHVRRPAFTSSPCQDDHQAGYTSTQRSVTVSKLTTPSPIPTRPRPTPTPSRRRPRIPTASPTPTPSPRPRWRLVHQDVASFTSTPSENKTFQLHRYLDRWHSHREAASRRGRGTSATGTLGNAQNPVQTYGSASSQTVTLVVTNSAGVA